MIRFIMIMLIAGALTLRADAQGLTYQAEILWDEWGVPHIYAEDDVSSFYAFGWAQMHNHGDLMLKLYGEARGRAAEYWGSDYLQQDILFHTLNIPQQGADNYNAMTPEFRGYVGAFVAGINAYALAHPDLIGDEWERVLPVLPTDVIAHSVRTLRYEFVAGQGLSEARRLERRLGGSNAWAVAPSRSASGNALLLANPHQPWNDLSLWFEAHIVTPDNNLYGVTLIGGATLTIAFNEYLGWTHTVNVQDGWDLYALTLAADGAGYVFDGEVRQFNTREVTLRISQPDGSLREQTITVRESAHGPVVADGAGEAYALRVVGEWIYPAYYQWREMGLARNLAEFEAAIQRVGIPMFSITYADRDGNILGLHNAQIPIRSSGDWQFWNGTTLLTGGELSRIPGDSSDYLWTETHPYEDLPRLVNPASGWIQNANEPPWSMTLPPEFTPADYPAYFAPPPFAWGRPIQSMRMLSGDASITFDELRTYKFSNFAETTRSTLDPLLPLMSQSDDPLVQRAGEIFAAWDRRMDADSVGAALFTAWFTAYVERYGFDVYEVEWDINDPFNTPRQLRDPQVALEVLGEVARQLEALRPLGIGMDVVYGDVFRMRYGAYDLPAITGSDLEGTFAVLTPAPAADLRFQARHGDSYIALVEFSDPVRAEVLLTVGNATQPHSPHVGDQLPLYAARQLRPALLTRAEVEAGAVRREELSE